MTGSSPSSQSLTFNDGNQISKTGYSYDGAGNLTASPFRSATFNAAGQQTTATVSGTTSSYSYAGTNANELLDENVPNDHDYSYTYGRPDRAGLPEIDSVTVSGIGTGYVISDPSGQPIMLSTSSGNTLLYVYDGLHNPVELSTSFNTTAQAYSFDPYGGRTTTNNTGFASAYENPYTFGGGLFDRATHEVKFGQRYYSTPLGSWSQQDALNAPLDPSNANRYAYVAGNPVNGFDPTGRFSWDDFTNDVSNFAGTGAVAGALIGGTLGLLGGPFAPITVPGGAEAGALIGGTVGGVIGGIYYFAS